MYYCSVPKNTIICEQGSLGNFFYIIIKGSVEITIDEAYVSTLKPGDSFGELALLHNAPRSATITAIEESYFWCLDRAIFKNIITQISNLTFEENKNFIDTIPMLSNK